jgi:hypothetical protein
LGIKQNDDTSLIAKVADVETKTKLEIGVLLSGKNQILSMGYNYMYHDKFFDSCFGVVWLAKNDG